MPFNKGDDEVISLSLKSTIKRKKKKKRNKKSKTNKHPDFMETIF